MLGPVLTEMVFMGAIIDLLEMQVSLGQKLSNDELMMMMMMMMVMNCFFC